MTLSGFPSIRKELRTKEIFFLSLSLYKRNLPRFLTIFLLAEVASVPINALIPMLFPIQYPMATLLSLWSQFTIDLSSVPISLVTVAVLSPITSISSGMAVSLASEMVEKEGSGLRTSYKTTIGNMKQIWSLTLITGFVNALSDPFLILPILFAILFFMALPAVIIENKGAFGGIGRSRRLLSKRWGEIFLLLLIVGLIAELPLLVIEQIFSLPSPVGMAMSGIETALIGPLYAIASTTAFYSNSVRLSDEEKVKKIETNKSSRLWTCRNCKTTFVSVSMPSPAAFGGCRSAKRSFFSTSKHDWAEGTSLPNNGQS